MPVLSTSNTSNSGISTSTYFSSSSFMTADSINSLTIDDTLSNINTELIVLDALIGVDTLAILFFVAAIIEIDIVINGLSASVNNITKSLIPYEE